MQSVSRTMLTLLRSVIFFCHFIPDVSDFILTLLTFWIYFFFVVSFSYNFIKFNFSNIFILQQKELDKAKTKFTNLEKDHETEKENLLKRKDNEISELKQQLEVAAENVNKQEIQTQAHKQVLDQITMEKEAVQVRSRSG